MRLPSLVAVLVAVGISVAEPLFAKRSSEAAVFPRNPQDATPARPPPRCLHAQSRLCWDGRNDINTNYYTAGPRTGRTVTYNFDIKNITLSPDGRPRQALAINGKIPGPNIVANWGDRVRIVVKNSMQHNGTSIHWHGIRMFKNFLNDGVNGVTECPIAPGDTKVYEWIAEQYGTSWYHSHYSAQYGDGVWGTMQINGPAAAEYDIDLGPISLSDWFWPKTAFQTAYASERTGPPSPQNFLVGGTNVNPANETQGKRYNLKFTKGKTHRLRFVNTSVDSFFRVSLDGHNMTVIQTDFVPVQPYTTQTIGIAIGQRYDVLITADQPVSHYWLRTIPQTSCAPRNENNGLGTANAYISYNGAPAGLPSTTPHAFTDNCNDETTLTSVVPVVPVNADASGFPGNSTNLQVSAPIRVNVSGSNVFRWTIGGPLPMNVNFSNPAVQILKNGQPMPADLNSFTIDGAASTVYFLVQNAAPIAHPIHQHGHDAHVVSQGPGAFDPATSVVKWDNPPRRDVTMLPPGGHILFAYKADNPGIWLTHCHIAWHVSEGLSLQLIERKNEIFNFTRLDTTWQNTCKRWNTWYTSPRNPYGEKTDSGLRQPAPSPTPEPEPEPEADN